MRKCFFIAFLAYGGASYAQITGTTGQAVEVVAPPSAALGAYESNTEARVWLERLDYTLLANLSVDAVAPGLYDSNGDLSNSTILSGTRINSFHLHLDTVGSGVGAFSGTITFATPILGVIARLGNLSASDATVGALGTTYAGALTLREFELSGNEFFRISADSLTLSFAGQTSTVIDDLRVITASSVPGPGAGLVFAAALLRRRRSR